MDVAPEVYVQAFPALGAVFPVTVSGGTTPIWAPDGKHRYYIANEQVNVATVSTSPSFSVTSRQLLFEGTSVSERQCMRRTTSPRMGSICC